MSLNSNKQNSIHHEIDFNENSFAIEVRDLKRYFKIKYETIKAVDGITFNVKWGECFGFLGPNGAGKTTTINMLNGLLEPSEGTALIGGYNIRKDINKIHEIIGVCPQEPAVFKFLNGRENIELFGNLYGIPKKKLKERTNMLLEQFQLIEASKRKTKGYSGGMIRRLNLVISLISDPKIAFFDEPTVGMDPQSRRVNWDYIGFLKEQGKTIFLTTHYIEEAQVLSDRVAFIDYGKIIALDTPKALIEKYNAKNLEDVFIKLTGRKIRED